MKAYWEWILREGENGAGAGASGSAQEKQGEGDGNSGEGAAGAEGAGGGAAAASGDGSEDGSDGSEGSKGKARGSIYEEAGMEPPGTKGSPAWPDDWRQQIAGEDKAKLNVLDRYDSPQKALDALFAMRQRLSSGEYKRQLGEDATDAEKAEWRTEQGIPETADKYELPVAMDADAEEMTEDQQAVYKSWQDTFHGLNLPQGTAEAIAKHANDIYEAQLEAEAENDAKQMDAFEDAMRSKWGGDFRVNGRMNAKYLTDTLGGEDQMKAFVNSRMPDGTLIKNSAEFAELIQKAARSEGMTGSYESGDVSTYNDKVSRKGQLEEIQRTGSEPYTPALRKEYNEILTALEGKVDIAV